MTTEPEQHHQPSDLQVALFNMVRTMLVATAMEDGLASNKIILTNNIKEHTANNTVTFTVFTSVQSCHVLGNTTDQQTEFTTCICADLVLIPNGNDSPTGTGVQPMFKMVAVLLIMPNNIGTGRCVTLQ